MELIRELWSARLERYEKAEHRLVTNAYFLGRSVARHENTMSDARARLARWVRRKDPDTWYWDRSGRRVDVSVFATPDGHDLAARAFARGFTDGGGRV